MIICVRIEMDAGTVAAMDGRIGDPVDGTMKDLVTDGIIVVRVLCGIDVPVFRMDLMQVSKPDLRREETVDSMVVRLAADA